MAAVNLLVNTGGRGVDQKAPRDYARAKPVLRTSKGSQERKVLISRVEFRNFFSLRPCARYSGRLAGC
jgi:hypothetical protein